MRIIPLKLGIILLFLSSINFLYANEKEDFNIGYYDLEKDIRYDEWGVHPVDIRSNTNQLYKRPLAGAKLGLKDIKPFQRMAKVKFKLMEMRIKNIDSAADEILNHTNTYRLILEKIALYNDTQWYIVLEGNYLEKIFFLVLYFQPIFFGWYDLFFREKLFLV